MKLYRAENLIDLETLQNTSIALVGMGSLGSLVASLLAYPWGTITLIDPEKLEDDNVERHLLGFSQVGKYKVDGVAEWLIDRGIDPKRIVRVTDMRQEMDALLMADIMIVSIDDPEPCYEVNQLSVNHNIPAVYGGVYPMGTGGQTVVLPCPADICYLCVEKMMGVLEYQGKKADGDYGVDPMSLIGKAGVLKAVPALKYSIAAVASDMAVAVMNILAKTAEPGILIHAQTWEGVLSLSPGQSLNQIAGYISSQSNLGMIANMKLERREESYLMSVKQGKVGLGLKRWLICPAHGPSTSPDQI